MLMLKKKLGSGIAGVFLSAWENGLYFSEDVAMSQNCQLPQWTLCLLTWLVALPVCRGLTTTYTFSSPPDNVFVSIGGTGSSGYPSQLLDTQIAVESVRGIEFDNLLIDTGSSADFNGDGAVDEEDLALWRNRYAGNGADADGDGDTDGTDVLIWQREYTGPTQLSAVVVPEPSCLLLGLIAVVTLTMDSTRRGR